MTDFPASVQVNFPLCNIEEGHCLWCGLLNSEIDMSSSDHSQRIGHERCYQREIVKKVNYLDIITNKPLPIEKVQAQIRNPTDISCNVAEGESLDYLAYVSGIILGYGTVSNKRMMGQ